MLRAHQCHIACIIASPTATSATSVPPAASPREDIARAAFCLRCQRREHTVTRAQRCTQGHQHGVASCLVKPWKCTAALQARLDAVQWLAANRGPRLHITVLIKVSAWVGPGAGACCTQVSAYMGGSEQHVRVDECASAEGLGCLAGAEGCHVAVPEAGWHRSREIYSCARHEWSPRARLHEGSRAATRATRPELAESAPLSRNQSSFLAIDSAQQHEHASLP